MALPPSDRFPAVGSPASQIASGTGAGVVTPPTPRPALAIPPWRLSVPGNLVPADTEQPPSKEDSNRALGGSGSAVATAVGAGLTIAVPGRKTGAVAVPPPGTHGVRVLQESVVMPRAPRQPLSFRMIAVIVGAILTVVALIIITIVMS